jgi:hypothetical protein
VNPDDLLELLKAATIGLRGDPNRATPRGLPQDQLAKIRQGIKAARADGVSDEEIGAYVQRTYGRSLAEVTTPTRRDYGRAAVPFGLADEMAGIVKMLPLRGQLGATPGSYSEARDVTRENLAGAEAIAPKRMLAAEVAGSLPLAALGGPAAQGLSGGARAVAAAEAGGLLGALSGFGHSEADNLSGLVDDSGAGTVMGTGVGLLGSAGGQVLGKVVNPLVDRFSPQRPVLREVAALLPDNAGQSIARQDALAPGTSAVVDQVPGLARIVGQSREAARTGVEQTAERVRMLDRARQSVGQRYSAFNDQNLPVDDELRGIVGSRLDLGEAVDFKSVHALRSDVGRRLNDARKAYQLRQEQGDVVAELTPVKEGLDTWLRSRVPGLEQVDKDYGAVMGMLQRARGVEKIAKRSQEAHGARRAGGQASASVGGSLTRPPGFSDLLAKVLAPNPEKRAEVVRRLLMDPRSTQRTMGLLAREESPFDALMGRGLLFGASANVPSLIGQ